jgi:hypothetical protein
MPQSRARTIETSEAAAPPSRTRGPERTVVPATPAEAAPASSQRCDFCGAETTTVRRVALDRDYDRLQKAHRELYACGPCSDRKEGRRLGLGR